jgi:hypothetical protein
MLELEQKQQVISEIERHRERWDAVLQTIESGNLDGQPVLGDWTPKDLVGHINGWQRYTIDRLVAQRNGMATAVPPWPDYLQRAGKSNEERIEGINNWIYQTNRERSTADVIAESRMQWDTLIAFAKMLTESEMQDESRFGRLGGESFASAVLSGSLFDHMNNEHGEDVEAILGTN